LNDDEKFIASTQKYSNTGITIFRIEIKGKSLQILPSLQTEHKKNTSNYFQATSAFQKTTKTMIIVPTSFFPNSHFHHGRRKLLLHAGLGSAVTHSFENITHDLSKTAVVDQYCVETSDSNSAHG
jgi:hypothetical protein